MSARKLGRLCGFLFMLAAMLGVVGTASATVVEDRAETAYSVGAETAATFRMLDTHWG